MTQIQTGSYDILTAISESGLERIIRASFFEEQAPFGLPAVYSDSSMTALLGLPNVALLPSTTVYNTSKRPLTVENVVAISIPFSEATFTSVIIPALGCMSGVLTILIPIIEEGVLSFNTDNLYATLALSDDDPDPNANDRTSMEKLMVLEGQLNQIAVLLGQDPIDLQSTLEQQMTTQFRNNPPAGLTDVVVKSGLDQFFELGNCQTSADDVPQSETTPVLESPTKFLCIDPKIETAALSPTGDLTNLLLIKGKMSSRSVALGTETDADVVDTSWVKFDDDIGILVSNRFLLNELLAPNLIWALLDGVIDENCREINLQNPNPVLHYFEYPFTLKNIIPKRERLPSVTDFFSSTEPQESGSSDECEPVEPNIWITNLRVAIPPSDSSYVRITIDVKGKEIGYTFTARITLKVIFTHYLGKLKILIDPEEPVVQVNFEPWVYALGITIGLFSPLIGGAVLAGILVLLADVGIDTLASSMIEDAIDVTVPADDLDNLLGSIVVNRVNLDDLYIGGNFRITHLKGGYCGIDDTNEDEEEPNACDPELIEDSENNDTNEDDIDPGGCTPVLIEYKSVESEQHLEFNTMTSPTSIRFGEDEVALLTQSELQPTNETRFSDLGQMAKYQSDNFSQVDLRHPQLEYTTSSIDYTDADISLYVADVPDPEEGPDISNPIDLVSPLEYPVRMAAFLTATGQYGCLIVWRDPNGTTHLISRLYRQRTPGLKIVLSKRPQLPDRGINTACIKQLIDNGDIKHGYQSPTIVKQWLRSSTSEQVELPTGKTVSVGNADYDRQLDAVAVAIPVLMLPLTNPIAWSVIRSDGSEVKIASTGEVEINVDVGGARHIVTFIVSGEKGELCQITSQPGDDLDFTLKATAKGCSENTAVYPIKLNGRKIEVFGYAHWVEEFEKQRSIILKDLNDGRGPYPDPIRNVVLGVGMEIRAIEFNQMDARNQRFETFRYGLTAEEFLRQNNATDGKRGLQIGDIIQHTGYTLLGEARPLHRDRALPLELTSASANAYIAQTVTETFDALRSHFGESKRLSAYEADVNKSLNSLPNAGELLDQIPPREKSRR